MLPELLNRLFWRRKDERLQQFAETEAFGARDLANAAMQVQDPWLRRQLVLHAQDEVRHASLLEEGTAPPPRPGLGASVLGDAPAEQGIDLQAMGEVRFLAFVHLAEKRAVEEFQLHRLALGEDGARFDSILADEKRHVAWTGHALERFRKAGRQAEVEAALRALRRQRWMNAWLAIARRLSHWTSALLLGLVHLLLVGPFSLLAGRFATGWQRPPRGPIQRTF